MEFQKTQQGQGELVAVAGVLVLKEDKEYYQNLMKGVSKTKKASRRHRLAGTGFNSRK
jgi:hypothetical protein